MRDVVISNCERDFIREAILQNRRIDGRHALEFRNLDVVFGADFGSCQASLGKTKAFAKVISEVVSPQGSRPSEGILFINVELNAMAAPEFEAGRPSDAAIEITRTVERCIRDSRCIDLESLCVISGSQVWQVKVYVQIINHDGNMTDCACLAAMAALMHFRRPYVTVSGDDIIIHPVEKRDPIPLSIHHIPICITFAFLDTGNRLLVDPTEREEQVMEGKMTVAVNSHREICTIHVGSSTLLTTEQVSRCIEIAAIRANEITATLKKAINDYNSAKKAGDAVGFPEAIKISHVTVNKLSPIRIPIEDLEVSDCEEMETNEVADAKETKVIKRGPKTVGLEVGDGGQSSWVGISEDEVDDDDDEHNDVKNKEISLNKDNNFNDEEEVIMLKPSEFESKIKSETPIATVDLTKSLKKRNKR